METWLSLQEYYMLPPFKVETGMKVAVKVVASIGWGNDWAAYRGPSDWSDERVAEQGDKLGQEAAEALFPTFRNSGRYYRG